MQKQPMTHEVDIAFLYQRYASGIFAYLRHHLFSLEDAEDILVDVFLAALEEEKMMRLTEQERAAWLWRVTRNKVADVYRHSHSSQQIPLEYLAEIPSTESDLVPEKVIVHQEELNQLQGSLKCLSPLHQEVVRLRFDQNLTAAEIAVLVKKSEGAVRAVLSRALRHLRTMSHSW